MSTADGILCHFRKIPQIQTTQIDGSEGVINGHPSAELQLWYELLQSLFSQRKVRRWNLVQTDFACFMWLASWKRKLITQKKRGFSRSRTRPLHWTLNTKDESNGLIKINCGTSLVGEQTKVRIEYDAFKLFNLVNVQISIPIKVGEAEIQKSVIGEGRG